MKYRQVAPIPELRAIVDRIWTLETEPGDAASHSEPVLPDGCPELVMQFGDPFERIHDDGTPERQSDIVFAGQLTRQISLRPTGAVATLGVRFRPGSAAAVLHMPQQLILGTTPGVEALDGRLFRGLAAVRNTSCTLDDASDAIQTYLTTRAREWRWDGARMRVCGSAALHPRLYRACRLPARSPPNSTRSAEWIFHEHATAIAPSTLYM
jgi:uncharacterized protein DUF6597